MREVSHIHKVNKCQIQTPHENNTAFFSKMTSEKSKRVVINISGEIFETFEATLNRFPCTLLGNLKKRRQFSCARTDQCFFNRNRKCFGAILFFYQSDGILSCPHDVEVAMFESECKYFELPDYMINKMVMKEGILPEIQSIKEADYQHRTYLLHCWDICENPESSVTAWLYSLYSALLILVSIISTCLETIPYYRNGSDNLDENPWLLVDVVLNSWFLVELLTRFATSPDKWKFIRSCLNWIDVFAIVPYFILLCFTMMSTDVVSLIFLRIFRFIRIFRLFRFSKHSKRLQVVGEIMRWSLHDVLFLVLDIWMLVLLGGTGIYFLEGYNSTTTEFTSIPASFWWAVITVTTVGYGDMTPLTISGRLFSVAFMTIGILVLTLPVLYIANKYIVLYTKNLK